MVMEMRKRSSTNQQTSPAHLSRRLLGEKESSKMYSKRILALFAILIFGLVLPGCSQGNPFIDPVKYRQESPYEYYRYTPSKYSAGSYWPVFIYIHGEGGSGLDCWNVFQKYADKEGFILVCPSLADNNGGWYQQDGEAKLLAVLGQVFSGFSVYQQVFLAGLSAGGQFVQGFAFDYPQYVAGVSVIAPGNVYQPSGSAYAKPFYVMVGDRDNPNIIEGSKQLARNLSGLGYPVHYFEMPGVGHQLVEREIELTLELYRSIFKTSL
jgi:pimeloyl-ACP methyl ester carboxylesterase